MSDARFKEKIKWEETFKMAVFVYIQDHPLIAPAQLVWLTLTDKNKSEIPILKAEFNLVDLYDWTLTSSLWLDIMNFPPNL